MSSWLLLQGAVPDGGSGWASSVLILVLGTAAGGVVAVIEALLSRRRHRGGRELRPQDEGVASADEAGPQAPR